MIRISSTDDIVSAEFVSADENTSVCAAGSTLTEAIENLVVRFKELQDAALTEMRDRGFIRTERLVLEIKEPS